MLSVPDGRPLRASGTPIPTAMTGESWTADISLYGGTDMKKILLIILAVCLLFLASSCGKPPFVPDPAKAAGVIIVNGRPDEKDEPDGDGSDLEERR